MTAPDCTDKLVGNAKQRRHFQRATRRAFGSTLAGIGNRLYGKRWASLMVFSRRLILEAA